MSFLKRLFGGAPSEPEPEIYKDFRIIPTPIPEGSDYRVSARVEKEINGETRVHSLIRADTVSGLEAAEETSRTKARQVIDAMGDSIFD